MTFTASNWETWAQSFPAHAAKDAPYKSPFTIVNKGSEDEDAEILVYDVIGKDWWSGEGWAANDFADKLKEINPKARLVVGINSPGGNVDDGLAIFNMVQRRGNVVTRNDGMAASIASVILQAGTERQSAESAMVMIHKAWSIFAGNADDSRRFAEVLDKHDQVIAETYARRSGKDVTGFMKLMADETWFTGNEAKQAGLVDAIATPKGTNNLAAQSSAPSKPLAKTQPDDSAATTTPKASANGRGDANASPAFSASAVAVADGQLTAAITNQTTEKPMPENTTPAVANQSADIIVALKEGFADLKNTITANTLPGAAPLTGSTRVENLGNPLVEKYNSLAYDKVAQAQLAKGLYNDVRKQLMIANGISDANLLAGNFDRFDFSDRKIVNANTVDAALANTILAGDFVTTMRTKTAMWSAFTKTVSPSPVSRRQTLEVSLVSTAGGAQTNATNYESGDSTLAPIAITVSEYSRSFHVTRPQTNLGLQLAALAPTNALVLAEALNTLFTAVMTNANYGADVVIGAAADFSSTDLPAILALGKNYDRCTLVLDGGHLAYLLPTTRESFAFGEPGAYGFDGGIYKNNLWTSAATDICGLVCGPDAIVSAWGAADGLPAGEAISQATVDVNGYPFSSTVWFSRATREVWGSFQIMGGVQAGDKTQAEVLTTA